MVPVIILLGILIIIFRLTQWIQKETLSSPGLAGESRKKMQSKTPRIYKRDTNQIALRS